MCERFLLFPIPILTHIVNPLVVQKTPDKVSYSPKKFTEGNPQGSNKTHYLRREFTLL